jgi:hypothetical protein
MTDRPAPELLLDLSSAHIVARALHVVAELGTADQVDGDARPVTDLAAPAGVDPDALQRVLRLLETRGVFAADDVGRWCHTATSRLLRSDHPMSMRAFARMMGMPFGWDAVTALEHAMRSGDPSVLLLHPDGPWAYLADHPDQNAIFNQAMQAKAHADVAAVLAGYDFAGHRRIADIAGGSGHLVAAVLAAHEDLTGVLFELPHVAETVTPTPRLEVVAGDFFTDPLPSADAYVLMNVVHDWDDERATSILRAVRDAAPPGAKVLVVETILPEGPEAHWAKTLDVMMLALTGGRERTLSAYGALLHDTGFTIDRVHPTATAFSIIQAHPR